MDDLNKILVAGPYSINNKPIILKMWNPHFDINEEFLNEIPLWIKFPKLPVSYWSTDSLGKIASILGVPLFTDECTLKRTRISFARILVEVNITKPLSESINVLDPSGEIFEQQVLYDWRPTFCDRCLQLGHQCPPEEHPKPPQPRPRRRRRGQQQPEQVWISKVSEGPQQEQLGEKAPNPRQFEGARLHDKEQINTPLDQPRVDKRPILHQSDQQAQQSTTSPAQQGISAAQQPARATGKHEVESDHVTANFLPSEQRKGLWAQLNIISQQMTTPRLLWGDFNAIYVLEDYKVCTVSNSEVHDFQECVQKLTLTEVSWRGEYYTWTNKQKGGNRICSRLDRAMGNADWMAQFGHLVVDFKQPHISDHSPMILSMKLDNPNIKVSFKFFNVWAEHSNFLTIVAEGWRNQTNSSKMRMVWQRLKELRPAFKKLNNEEYKGVTEKINTARAQLKSVQAKMAQNYDDQLADVEHVTLQQLEKWSLIEEKILQQKSRATWIKLG
ncbi:uncharacterized protein LOC132057742 [Lycium ferocissimum]|uniref:uncharacterized protein LOC132057742 n=1 Tax=Lycium ferocissimum TaxID=112874 RepID=UPI002815F43B|nr:uncharacterized protein LOC132057742 [Lycium ferocissimum]